jgi:hypothetical protein
MADHEQDQKTEQPTEKHVTEAIERGKFARSSEMGLAFTLAATLGVIGLTATSASHEIANLTVNTLSNLGSANVAIDTASTVPGVAASTLGRVLVLNAAYDSATLRAAEEAAALENARPAKNNPTQKPGPIVSPSVAPPCPAPSLWSRPRPPSANPAQP